MADLDRRDAEISALKGSIQRYHQVSSSIQLGRSKKEVLGILLPTQQGVGRHGKSSEAFINNGSNFEIYYMRSSRIRDGNTTDDEFTPYVFVDNVLKGIGWKAIGGAKTYGNVKAAQNANKVKRQILLGLLGQHLPLQNRQQALTSGCDTGHWVSKVTDGGRFVSLEDSSFWEISSIDLIDTSLWLPTTNITICDGDTLINTDDGEKVSATRLR